MDKPRFPKGLKVYLPLLALVVVLLFLLPRSGKFAYDYSKGSPWAYETLVAQFDFPILKTAEQLQEEREALGSDVVPYYKHSGNVASSVVASLLKLELGPADTLKPLLADRLSSMYGKGVISSADARVSGSESTSGLIFIQRDKRVAKCALTEVFTVEEVKSQLLSTLTEGGISGNMDSLCVSSGLYNIVVPDLIFDQRATDLIQAESVDYISETSGIVRTGTAIVASGEIITAEIVQLLDSYKHEYEQNYGYDAPIGFLWLGNALLAIVVVLLLFFSILYTNGKVFGDFNRYIYLLMVFLIATAGALVVDRLNPGLLYMVPFTLVALYLLAFFKKRVVLPVYVLSLLPLLIFAHNGVELFVMFLFAGVISIFTFGILGRGWLQFVNSLVVFICLAAVWFVFRLRDGVIEITEYRTLLYMFFGSLFTVAAYPLIYLFEKVFMLVSSTRLMELCDTNNKALRLMADKAPGTFQHSLQVMNMADAAARAVGADVLLVRTGALYHDLGKVNNPQCFVENETLGQHYHSGLTPLESARDITRHVTDGLALAEKYNLPSIITEFIRSHHGTSTVGFFYTKYLNDGGAPDAPEASDFFYNGVKPVTKEQIILMICDSVEAASRSLKDYSQQSVSALVENICKSKIEDGQFEDADISIREINVVKEVLKDYIQQIYHSRIAYPKRKKNQQSNQ